MRWKAVRSRCRAERRCDAGVEKKGGGREWKGGAELRGGGLEWHGGQKWRREEVQSGDEEARS